LKYPILKNQVADMNFNRNQIVGLKKLTIGSGTNQFTLIGGKMWGGGNTFDTGIFQLDLGAKTLLMTGNATFSGTVNATGGIFSGDITLSGDLTGGTFRTSALTNVERVIISTEDTNNKYIQLWNTSNAIRGWLGKGPGSSVDVALHSAGNLCFSVKTGSGTYDRKVYLSTSVLGPDTNEEISLGTSGVRYNDIYGKKIHANRFAAGAGAGTDGVDDQTETGVTNFDITIKGGLVTWFEKH
jgi:hypothetical protein